jgi:hypothetical protein
MSGGSSWRSPSTADQYQHHDYADFAQEYLQRNADYRSDYAETEARVAAHPDVDLIEREGLAGGGAFAFPTAPESDPRTAPALWSPAEAPDVVVLATTDIEAAVSLPADFESLAEAISNSEHHMVFGRELLGFAFACAPCHPCAPNV